MRKAYVYTISDESGNVFYVGSTILRNPKDRFSYHLSIAKKSDNSLSKKLKSIDYKAFFNIVKTIEGAETLKLISAVRSCEFCHIKSLLNSGAELCNVVYNHTKKRA